VKVWSSGRKLMVIIPVFLLGATGTFGYLEWEGLPRRVLVADETQAIDHTIGAILQTRAKPTKYLLFSPEDIATVLAGAELRFRGSTSLVTQKLTADSGRVTWRNGKYDNHKVPGLFLRVQATMHGTSGSGPTTDTLMLKLPGLSTLGARFNDDPRISFNGNTPYAGDSVIMEIYKSYPDHAAVERARTPYLALSLAMGLLIVAILARAVIWSIS
jgi:hypothetical protein